MRSARSYASGTPEKNIQLPGMKSCGSSSHAFIRSAVQLPLTERSAWV